VAGCNGAASEIARRRARDALPDTIACTIAGVGDEGRHRMRGILRAALAGSR